MGGHLYTPRFEAGGLSPPRARLASLIFPCPRLNALALRLRSPAKTASYAGYPPTDLDNDFRQVSVLPQLSRSYSSNSINPVSRSKQTSTLSRAVTPPCLPLPPYLRTGSTQRTTPQPVDKVSTPYLLISGRRLTWSTIRSFWTSLLISKGPEME